MFCVRPTWEVVFNTRPKNLNDPAIRFLAEKNVGPPAIKIRQRAFSISYADITRALRNPHRPQCPKAWDIPGLPKVLGYDMYDAISSLCAWAARICVVVENSSPVPFYDPNAVVYFHKWKKDALFDGVLPLVVVYNPCVHIPEPPEKVAKNVA